MKVRLEEGDQQAAGRKSEILCGILVSCADGAMELSDEKLGKNVAVRLENIKEARIDFKF